MVSSVPRSWAATHAKVEFVHDPCIFLLVDLGIGAILIFAFPVPSFRMQTVSITCLCDAGSLWAHL